jgi:hypothetical protein
MRKISLKSKWLTGIILVTVIALLFGGCSLFNRPPVISSLAILTEGEINPGSLVSIKCIATDPDEDNLSYSWTADAGSFTDSGADVNWIAPDESGNYTIRAEVSDGHDTATDQIVVWVAIPNSPPVIQTMTAEYHRLKRASNTSITCVATDPDGDELTYTWSAVDENGNPAGNFTGEGETVTWVAPNAYGTYTITVTVSDGRGGATEGTDEIIVCSCGSAH